MEAEWWSRFIVPLKTDFVHYLDSLAGQGSGRFFEIGDRLRSLQVPGFGLRSVILLEHVEDFGQDFCGLVAVDSVSRGSAGNGFVRMPAGQNIGELVKADQVPPQISFVLGLGLGDCFLSGGEGCDSGVGHFFDFFFDLGLGFLVP